MLNIFLMVIEITCLLKRHLNSWSKNVKWILLILAFVNFNDKLISAVGIKWCTLRREKALRDTRIRGIHEMEELRRAQELRVDELTSQIQDLQERVNSMNDSTEFQDFESICSGKLSHVPRLAVVPSPRSMSRDRILEPETWNSSGTHGNVFWLSTAYVRFITDTSSRNSS